MTGGCVATFDGPTVGSNSGTAAAAVAEGAGSGADANGCAVTTGDEMIHALILFILTLALYKSYTYLLIVDEADVADAVNDDSAPTVSADDAAANASSSLDGGKRNTDPAYVGDDAESDFADEGCDDLADDVDDLGVDFLEPTEPDRCPQNSGAT